MAEAEPLILHASAIAVQGRALLICGASGSGKSGLALQMIALGAALVSDDRTVLQTQGAEIRLGAPDSISGLIEARGLGILRCAEASTATLAAVLDMDMEETERLPPRRHTRLLGQSVPLLHKSASPHFPAALMLYLRRGRED